MEKNKDFLDFLKEETNYTTTENGDITYESTLNSNLDLFSFSKIDSKYEEVEQLIHSAYYENKNTFLKNFLYVLDIRGGKSIRSLTKHIIKFLIKEGEMNLIISLLDILARLGRFDFGVYALEIALKEKKDINQFKTYYVNLFNALFNEDEKLLSTISKMDINRAKLFWKWIPSLRVHGKNNIVAKIFKNWFYEHLSFKLREKAYRKLLNVKRKELGIIEKNLSNKEKIDFSNKPSKAIFSRLDYFFNNDLYAEDFVKAIKENKISNFNNLLISEIVAEGLYKENSEVKSKFLDYAWTQLPKLKNIPNGVLPVVDVSGSMNTTSDYHSALASSIGLGMYLAEQNEGYFKDHFITFSTKPKLVKIQGKNIVDKIKFINKANWEMSTNIDGVFELIYNAVKNGSAKSPEYITIFSDMQFDECISTSNSVNKTEEVNLTFIKRWKKQFEDINSTLPKIVFWNLNAPLGQAPVLKDELNTVLMSGFNANALQDLFTFEQVIREKEKQLTPLEMMNEVLSKYDVFIKEILEK